MSQFNAILAAQLVAPSTRDWCVRFTMHDGGVVARRVSPGSIDPSTAIQRACASLGRMRAQVRDTDCRRFEDIAKAATQVVVP